MKKTSLIIIPLILIIGLSGCIKINNPGGEDLDNDELKQIAQCLGDKGVKFYGAVWCGHCTTQKKSFGDAFKYLNYVECDPGTNLETAKICVEKGIEAVPAWEFSDGSRRTGYIAPSELGRLEGCL